MRILLDENLNWRLSSELPGHEVDAVVKLGWAGIPNGMLLKRAADHGFHVLITMDANIPYQQNLTDLTLAVIALRAKTNRLQDTAPLMPFVLDALQTLTPGTLLRLPS